MSSVPLVSIILPVYNGDKYLSTAIDSIISQTYSNWELVVVDDGSKDRSAEICDNYQSKDTRIKAFHQPNAGVNSARAKGVDNATGDYLTFLDADDTLTQEALGVMIDSFSETIDVVCSGNEETILDKEAYLKALWKGQLLPGICTKMFRTALYKQIDYYLERQLAMGEDLLINSMYALNINQAKVISANVYKINENNDSSVTKTFKHNWEYEKYYFSKVKELFLDKCTELDSYEKINLLVNKSWLNAMKYTMLNGGSINYKDDEFQEVKSYFDTHKDQMGPSERLIFKIKNPALYRMVLKTYSRLRGKKR